MADFFDALYRWANTIAQVMFALDIVLFLPLSLIRPLRKFTGSMLVLYFHPSRLGSCSGS